MWLTDKKKERKQKRISFSLIDNFISTGISQKHNICQTLLFKSSKFKPGPFCRGEYFLQNSKTLDVDLKIKCSVLTLFVGY